MWPRPDDQELVRRMLTAHALACRTLHAKPGPGGREIWGWHGRTLGQPAITQQGRAWLRLQSSPTDQIVDTFWNGAVDAHRLVPPSIPRPRLLRWHEWTERLFTFRAELYEHVPARPVAAQAILATDPDLPRTWWTAIRHALDAIAAVPTDRVSLHRGFLAWAMPHYLGIPVKGHATIPYTTAHGDFQYANLCGPDLWILDWEGWGSAPAGYDIAMLHSYSLLVPAAAARIRDEFADLLATDTGRFAELAVITELLHTTTHGDNLELTEPLRRRASFLIGHAVPAVHSPPTGY